MMKLPGNKIVFLLMCICLPVLVKAQQFRYQCLTDTVRQTGFYSIPITPEMSAHMQTDFRDVRIWNEKKQQVPYIIGNGRVKFRNVVPLKIFALVENKLDDSGRSVIIIKKKVGYSAVSNITLTLRNTSVDRYASLSGSNNNKNWFIIGEHIVIHSSNETSSDSSTQSISFPLSSYKFLRLIIDNIKSDPINIINVDYSDYLDFTPTIRYVSNPKPKWAQVDSSNGTSYVKVLLQQPFRIDQVGFEIDGPKYFSRRCSILTSKQNIDNNNHPYFYELARFEIASNSQFGTAIPVFKTDSFFIAIENGENPPLTIKNVNTAQEMYGIKAWLEAGKAYTIMMDADNAVAPKYDLQQFQDSIPLVVSTLSVDKIQPVSAVIESDKKVPFPQKWLWLIMAGAVMLLGILTWRLTGEMRKKES